MLRQAQHDIFTSNSIMSKSSINSISSTPNIFIYGAGDVGSQLLYETIRSHANLQLPCNIILHNRTAKAARDAINEFGPLPSGISVKFAKDLAEVENADVVFSAVGVRPVLIAGVTKDAPLEYNKSPLYELAQALKKNCRNPLVIAVTNPAEISAKLVHEVSGMNPERIIGSGTLLDAMRFEREAQSRLGVEVKNVVIGNHNKDEMIFVRSGIAVVGGEISEEKILEIEKEIKTEGGRSLKKDGRGPSLLPAKAAVKLAMNFLHGRNSDEILSAAIYIPSMEEMAKSEKTPQDYYGAHGPCYLALPIKITRGAIAVDLRLTLKPEEQAALLKVAQRAREIQSAVTITPEGLASSQKLNHSLVEEKKEVAKVPGTIAYNTSQIGAVSSLSAANLVSRL
jgi:malate/lactate dehydrogenase